MIGMANYFGKYLPGLPRTCGGDFLLAIRKGWQPMMCENNKLCNAGSQVNQQFTIGALQVTKTVDGFIID
jgi:hypothetical protein